MNIRSHTGGKEDDLQQKIHNERRGKTKNKENLKLGREAHPTPEAHPGGPIKNPRRNKRSTSLAKRARSDITFGKWPRYEDLETRHQTCQKAHFLTPGEWYRWAVDRQRRFLLRKAACQVRIRYLIA
ncbi:hypothetical protein RUM43_006576 [Polyplax serrata]|uniref:Uncharacterized protein n=1 Tax=Polyplax serrata TaxID=468196 RepID=A0AAN8NYE8_POLSC